MTIRVYLDGLGREIRDEKAAGVESLSRQFIDAQRALKAEKNSLAVFDAVIFPEDELIVCTATLPHMGTEYIRFNL